MSPCPVVNPQIKITDNTSLSRTLSFFNYRSSCVAVHASRRPRFDNVSASTTGPNFAHFQVFRWDRHFTETYSPLGAFEFRPSSRSVEKTLGVVVVVVRTSLHADGNMSKCCVPSCKNSGKTKFTVRTPAIDAWERSLNLKLHPSSRVCESHFDPDDVIRTWESGNAFFKCTVRSTCCTRIANSLSTRNASSYCLKISQ